MGTAPGIAGEMMLPFRGPEFRATARVAKAFIRMLSGHPSPN
jgi:hypothetical protein